MIVKTRCKCICEQINKKILPIVTIFETDPTALVTVHE